jgi:hypothetical protein
MSWLAAAPALRTLGDALALTPDLLAGYRALEHAFAAEPELDRALQTRCRARVAMLLGFPGHGHVPASGDDVVLELVEQLVLDAHGVSDDLVARVRSVLSPRAIVTLAQAVVVWEGQYRLARCLDVAPEL